MKLASVSAWLSQWGFAGEFWTLLALAVIAIVAIILLVSVVGLILLIIPTPSTRFSRMVATRYLWSHRSEAFITIISVISVVGVALGVTVLTIVMAVMTGFQHELREKILGANSHVIVRSIGGKISDWKKFSDKIAKVDGVQSVAAYTYNQALLQTSSGATGLLIRGIEPQGAAADQLQSYLDPSQRAEALLRPQQVQIEDGSGEAQDVELPPLVVGHELTRTFALYGGSAVSLLAPTVSSSPFGLMPRFRRFVVTGTYRSGLVEYESGLAYTDLASAQKFFQLGSAISGFEVRVKNIDSAPFVARAILNALGGVGSGFYVEDWTETNKPLWDAIALEKRVYFIVLLLIIVMASFSIITTLVMIVLEKRRDIAVLRTLGANTISILRIFVLQGVIIGALGVGFGLALGWGGCLALQRYGWPLNEKVFQMSTLPVQIDPQNFALIGIAAFYICFLATLYPALRATRLQPTDLLRYE